MANFVLDASVAVATVLLDEVSEYSDLVLACFARRETAIAPAIWHVETINALLVRERRGTISKDVRDRDLVLIARYPVETDIHSNEPAVISAVTALAIRYQLTAYDAAYLELARRTKLPIATQDAAIIQAAKHLGVPLLS